MSSTNELMRINKSLTEINEKLSARIVSIEAELKHMRRKVALDEDFASYINSRDESSRKKDEYIKQLEAENEKLQEMKTELEKEARTWRSQAEKTAREYRLLDKEKNALQEQFDNWRNEHENYPFAYVTEPIDEYKTKYESLLKRQKREDVDNVETKWIINYAKNKPKTRAGATNIKDMLTKYYLENEKLPQADVLSKLREINKITEEYDENHPQQPLIGSADQVVVNNHGTVKHNNDSDNGQK